MTIHPEERGRAPKRPVLVLVGPTASGKTELLFELFARASRFGLPPAEIVSADSMQAYRGMDIGTAKPSLEERARLAHHLIDIRNPDEAWSAGDFVRLADEACQAIHARASLPVIAGGTGFYVRNFVFGLPGGPEASPATRAAVAEDLARLGSKALWEELVKADPLAAERMHPNNLPRLQRAVEILRQSGQPPSTFAPSLKPREDWDFLALWLDRPRQELYERIDARVELMFERGLAEEVSQLVAKGYGPDDPGMKAIGYSEFFRGEEASDAQLRGLGPDSLREVAEAVKLDTRRYAKRQETFFRGLPVAARIEVAGPGLPRGAVDEAARLVGAFLAGR